MYRGAGSLNSWSSRQLSALGSASVPVPSPEEKMKNHHRGKLTTGCRWRRGGRRGGWLDPGNDPGNASDGLGAKSGRGEGGFAAR